MFQKSLAELAKGLKAGEFTSRELTQHYLQRIEDLDEELNSFITVCPELALEQADAADAAIAAGTAGPLTGLPIAHKDLFCTQGVKTSCASKMLDNFIAPYESTVTANLRSAGMVMLGKTNMDEFAMGGSNENSFYGAVHNPWNVNLVPGGSSGGSAAAVAARLTPIATGTDTGGSIRQPAAFCGITGIKPTYGRVSRWGMVAFASSLDQAGPMAQTAEDCAMVLNAMAGHDRRDSTCMDHPVDDYTAKLGNSIKGLKIGLPKEYFEGLSEAMSTKVRAAVAELEKQGAIVKEISLPNTKLAIPTSYVLAPAEASTNLSRFDGVRFGYRCEDPVDLEDMYKRTRGEGFGKEVQRRIMIGTYALSAGYYDAYYNKALKTRRLLTNDFAEALKEVDVIAGPTAPTAAYEIGTQSKDPIAMYLADIFTLGVNLAGLPGISVPCGFIDEMPVGLQLIGRHFDESTLLNIGHQYQQTTDWHKQCPDMAQEENN